MMHDHDQKRQKASWFSLKETANRKCYLHGKKFDVYSQEILSKNKTFCIEFIHHPGAVVILPIIDPNTIVMIKNHRSAVQETLWELPAGTLEHQENPSVTASRELIEETGYQAERIEHLGDFFPSPGISDEKMYMYIATGLKEVGQRLEESEQITVEIKSWNEIFSMINQGEIRDGKTLTLLLYYHTLKR